MCACGVSVGGAATAGDVVHVARGWVADDGEKDVSGHRVRHEHRGDDDRRRQHVKMVEWEDGVEVILDR